MFILKKIIDYSVWVAFFAFFSFSTLFYFSKDSLPGDKLYPSKLLVEKILIAGSSVLNKQVDLQINYFSKRLDETTKVLASSHASESFARLDAQVETTTVSIAEIKDPGERKVAAAKYIAELNNASTVLKSEQTTLQQSSLYPTNNAKSVTTAEIQPTQTTKTAVVNPTSTPPSTPPIQEPVQNQPTEVQQNLEQSQQNINNTIGQMNTIINTKNGDDKDKDKDKKDKNKDKDNEDSKD